MGNRDVLQEYAEAYIRDHQALYDHYDVTEVTQIVAQRTGIELSDDETVEVVQRLRDERGWGQIAEHNLPGYVELEDELPGAVRSEEDGLNCSGHKEGEPKEDKPWWKF